MQWKVFEPAVTPEMVRLIQLAEEENRPHPVLESGKGGNTRIRAYLGEEAFRAASQFAADCSINPERSAVLHRAAEVLPSGLFTALVAICGMRMGFKTVEKELGWPTRSAKLVLAMALAELNRREVV